MCVCVCAILHRCAETSLIYRQPASCTFKLALLAPSPPPPAPQPPTPAWSLEMAMLLTFLPKLPDVGPEATLLPQLYCLPPPPPSPPPISLSLHMILTHLASGHCWRIEEGRRLSWGGGGRGPGGVAVGSCAGNYTTKNVHTHTHTHARTVLCEPAQAEGVHTHVYTRKHTHTHTHTHALRILCTTYTGPVSHAHTPRHTNTRRVYNATVHLQCSSY